MTSPTPHEPRRDPATASNLAVVVVTYQRLWHLERCLEALQDQVLPVSEVVVVDACPDLSAAQLSERFGATYLHNPSGYGHMTESRNLGWSAASAALVAFVDDDAFVSADWSQWITATFDDPSVGGAGGRAVTNPAQQPAPGSPEVGKVSDAGELIANFDAAIDHPVEVHHVIGCNMAFRRELLQRFNGFRADYPGTALREETDLCLRVLASGHRLVFEPRALAVHVGAPYSKGARFDLRYQYYSHRNHAQLLVRNVGFGAMTRRSTHNALSLAARRFLRDLVAAPARLVTSIVGVISGLFAGLRARRSDRRNGTLNDVGPLELEDVIRASDPR